MNAKGNSVLQELSAVHTQYEKIKIGLAGPEAERPVRSLDMIQSQLVDNIMRFGYFLITI